MAMRDGWRLLAGAAMLALVLTLGFSRESFALWPLFTVIDFPGQVGRAAALFLNQGPAPALVLGPAPDHRIAAAPFVEILAGALGLGLSLAAGAFCLYAATRPRIRQPALLATSALLLLGGIWPPFEWLHALAPLLAGAVLGALALPALAAQSEIAMQVLGCCFLLAPVWEMREPLFVSGAPGTDLALLERGTGIPPTIWSILGLALSAFVVMKLLPRAAESGPAQAAQSS
jgi:hypothetical protein